MRGNNGPAMGEERGRRERGGHIAVELPNSYVGKLCESEDVAKFTVYEGKH